MIKNYTLSIYRKNKCYFFSPLVCPSQINNYEQKVTETVNNSNNIKGGLVLFLVKHSKKAKLNIMHMTVNFLGFFFRTSKIFFSPTRSSCLSVRMTDNFSASFGKSAVNGIPTLSLQITGSLLAI